MGNLKRFNEEGMVYFVTSVTKNRAVLFRDPKLCRILLITIEYHKTVFDYKVYGYCLMPDHIHLLLQPEGQFNLSFIMRMIKGSFARKVNRLSNQCGSIWQRRFYDEAVRSKEQLYHQLEYMHQNPVAAKLVSSAEEYPFSSFSQYYGSPNLQGDILKIEMPE